MPISFVVNYSGGICSWYAARQIVDRFGLANVTLLFADTNMECPDLYRFLEESSLDLGIPITRIADGRTPWEVFFNVRFMGNSRIDPCSRILKREPLDRWHKANCDPVTTRIVVGLAAYEKDRYIRFRAKMRSKGWRVQAPAMATGATKDDMLRALQARGIAPPDLYDEGFPHNNCGGFCIKMGIKQANHLLLKRPSTYAHHEAKEQEFIGFIGKDVSILKDRSGGVTRTLTLKTVRERAQAQRPLFGDWGGCGCAIE